MKTIVSEKGQITIPKPLRERLGLGTGQVLEAHEEMSCLVMTKATNADPFKKYFGVLKPGKTIGEIMTELRGRTPLVVTAVDRSVIFDFATGDPQFGGRSKAARASRIAQGRVVACEVVWAEVAGYFPSGAIAHQMLNDLGVEFDAMTLKAALESLCENS